MKRKLFSIVLTVLVLLETVALAAVPVSAEDWSWRSDGKFKVNSYNALIVDAGSISVDAKLDNVYLNGTKITSYPDESPYLREGYEELWADAKAEFEAYVALDTNGLYIYAEIEDTTIHPSTNTNGNDGDFFQIYLDWCTEDIVHPTPDELYSAYSAGNAWNYSSYYNAYSYTGLQYIGYLSADYNGSIAAAGGFYPYDQLGPRGNESIVYKAALIDGGWACEWFIPWRDDAQKAAVRNKEQFPLGIGFQAADDTDINNTRTGETDVALRYDQRKEIGLGYWSDYSRLSDVVFLAGCEHSWKNGEVIQPATCTKTGTMEKICEKCGATKNTIISTLGHSAKSVICTVGKKKDMVCQRCGVATRTNVNASVAADAPESHVWGEATHFGATCTRGEGDVIACKYCDKVNESFAPASGHTYVYSATKNKYVCSACGTRAPMGDTNGDGEVTNADTLAIFKYIYNPSLYPVSIAELADVNSDGELNNVDALTLLKYVYDPDKYPLESAYTSIAIDGTDISYYTIVYNADNKNGEKELAEKLAEHFYDAYGVKPVVSSSWNGEKKAIVIGDHPTYVTSDIKSKIGAYPSYKLDMNNAMIASADSILWVAAANSHTAKAAVNKLIELTTPKTENDKIALEFSTAMTAVNVVTEDLGEELKIMSYNVQTGTPDSTRVTNMIGNITSFMPDVLGTQEVNYNWIGHFKNTGLLDEYTFVGEPRNGNKDTDHTNGNEYSAILFRTSKFNLIDSGTFWLSDTPTVPGTMHSSSDYIRIMTYAVLERKSDGMRFVHVNTHLEWDHGEIKTNLIQINIMLDLVGSKIYSKYGELPTYYTGDFNVTETSDGYARMISSGHSDSRYVAKTTTNENTFSGGSRIDFCFVSNDDFLVKEFDVGHGLAGSDHYPVYIRAYFN